jgi:hypothetical protein
MQSPAAKTPAAKTPAAKRQKVAPTTCFFCEEATYVAKAAIAPDVLSCEHCMVMYRLRCSSDGCTGHASDLSEWELQALKFYEAYDSRTGRMKMHKCKDCAMHTWYHCTMCGKVESTELLTPAPLPDRDPRDPYDAGPLRPVEEHRGIYMGGPVRDKNVTRCGECRLVRCIRCQRVDELDFNSTSVCTNPGHRYCEDCVREVPDWFEGLCCLSCFIPGAFKYKEEELDLVSRAVGYSTGLPPVLTSIINDYLPECELDLCEGDRCPYSPLYCPTSPACSPRTPPSRPSSPL